MQVTDPVDGDIPVDDIPASQLDVSGMSDNITVTTGERIWVPFEITMPQQTTAKMEVKKA